MPLDGAIKKALFKVPEDQRAEVTAAFEQLWANRDRLAQDLGPLAPDAAEAQRLSVRTNHVHETRLRSDRFSQWISDQEAIANHDAIAFLNTAADDIRHMITKRPGLAAVYEKVLKVSEQRGQAISEGIARKQAEKRAAEEAAAEAEANKAAEKKSA